MDGLMDGRTDGADHYIPAGWGIIMSLTQFILLLLVTCNYELLQVKMGDICPTVLLKINFKIQDIKKT